MFYQGLLYLHIPGALGFAIILLTITIKLVMYPLNTSQLKSAKKMQELNPHLSNLRTKHKGDSKMLHSETMKLYKDHGVNPAAGCLPLIVQIVILMFGLYPVFDQVLKLPSSQVVSEINKIVYFDWLHLTRVWDPNFFGIPLGKTPAQLLSTMPVVALAIPLLTALFQFVQSKMMFSTPPQTALVKKSSGKEEKKEPDFATTFQTQSLYIFPFIIGITAFSFPFGLALYWNTYTVFGILQQYHVQGLGGLQSWVDRYPLLKGLNKNDNKKETKRK